MTTIQLHNTLTRRKEPLTPLDPSHVRMYVCGPTVYDRPHLGNARSVVVYDLLFRLLREVYGEDHVTYARNITDVDDKINAAAVARGITIRTLTEEITAQFHADTDALGCLRPSIEPRATEHIPEMIAMIQALIARGNAYVSEGHVLFDVTSKQSQVASRKSQAAGKDGEKNPCALRLATCDSPPWHYGMLSGRKLEDLQAGARVEVEGYKRHPGDFVLWKPASEKDDASSRFASPWGIGRPGWHIECSAMAEKHLGEDFDIHGGGADLMFPHHENEIAQSCCAHPHSSYARLWVHNGFLTVGGEKMSKSLGNFTTVRDLLDRGIKGEAIRLAFLSVKYNEPLDWTEKLLADAQKALDGWYRKLAADETPAAKAPAAFLEALADDLNLPRAIALMHQTKDTAELRAMGTLLGILQQDPQRWFKGVTIEVPTVRFKVTVGTPTMVQQIGEERIEQLIVARKAAKAAKNFAESDRIRDALKAQGIVLEDKPGGVTEWRRG